VLNRQYAFWRGMVTRLLEGGTYVVPVPGNHETQDKAAGKKSKVANEVLWRDDMADQITTDQKQLTCSFDVGTTHFAVVNTDPVGNDAHAPAAWLAADFAAARAAGAKRFFVFGHKPAFSYFYALASGVPTTKLNGLDAVADLSGRDAFWKVIEDHGATYFCGHEHIYDVSQPRGRAYQVIVDSGGSPFESDAAALVVAARVRRLAPSRPRWRASLGACARGGPRGAARLQVERRRLGARRQREAPAKIANGHRTGLCDPGPDQRLAEDLLGRLLRPRRYPEGELSVLG
jgi:3',5'-cyclic AMP phosphodiesterase CpdA